MKKSVLLSISAVQYYPEQPPQSVELVTEGTLEFVDDGWDICYEESELTGLAGVRTKLRLETEQVILARSGKLRSQMAFRQGVEHSSLYETEFGTMMLTVCARMIEASIGEQGGTVDLQYSIEIENSDAGLVQYHLDVRVKQ